MYSFCIFFMFVTLFKGNIMNEKQDSNRNKQNTAKIETAKEQPEKDLAAAKAKATAEKTGPAAEDTANPGANGGEHSGPAAEKPAAGRAATTAPEQPVTAAGGAAADENRVNAAADLLQGPILPTLLKLSYPILIAMFFVTVFNIVDTFYVSRLGDDAITAMGFTFPIYMFLIAIGAGVTIGISSAVARALGAGDKEFAAETGKQGVALALAIGLFIALIGIPIAPKVLTFMGAEGDIFQMSYDYVSVIIFAGIAKYLLHVFDGTLRGEGHTGASMRMLLVASISNIILDPFFIFGIWFFPRLEVKGAAIATAISWVIGCLYALDYYRRGKGIFNLDFSRFTLGWQHLQEIVTVGVPASMNQGFLSLSLLFFNYILMRLPLGNTLVAAFSIGFRTEAIMILPLVGLSAGTVIMAGQNFGAGKLQRVEEIFLQGRKFLFQIMILMGIVIIALSPYLIKIFSTDPAVVKYGSQYFQFTALTYCFLGAGLLANATFQGMGCGYPPFINILIRLLFFQVAGAFFFTLCLQLGPRGAWGAVALANVGFGTISSLWVRSYLNRKLKTAGTNAAPEAEVSELQTL